MGVQNTWPSKSLPPSYFREASASGIHLDDVAKHRRAKSDLGSRPDDSIHKEDSSGDMSRKPPPKPSKLIDSHHSDHDSQKASHTYDISLDSAYTEFKRALRRVQRSGNKLYGMRLELKEKRNGLSYEREVLAKIEFRFMTAADQFREDPKEIFDESIYNQINAQRGVIGSSLYDYDQAEDEYDIRETQFEQEGQTLLNLLSRLRHVKSDGDEEKGGGGEEEESTSDSSSDSHLFRIGLESPGPTDAKSARVLEYESRIGDARIVQEQLQDLRYEQVRRLSISKKREKFGLGRNASDTSEDLELRYNEAAKELSIINEDIQRLREESLLDGYSLPESSTSKEAESVPAPQVDSPSIPAQRLKVRSASEGKMPILTQKMAAIKDRINRWMFITFQDSPVEHIRHKVILQDICPLDDNQWAHVVTEYWTGGTVMSDDGIHPPMLRSGLSKAEEAWKTFERDFPLTEAPKDRATPYNDKLEFDFLLELESRSQ